MDVIYAIIDFMYWLLTGLHMSLGGYDFNILNSILFAGIILLLITVIVAIFKGGRDE